jgi:hypothetical protein
MVFNMFSTIVCVALSISLVTAAPLALPKSEKLEKRSFSVTQSQNLAEQFDGAWALRKAYLKHGLPLPDHLVKRQLPLQQPPTLRPAGGITTHVTAMSVANDLEYVSPVEVGGTAMRLDFDTGSSDL